MVKQDSLVHVSVCDTGIGISETDQSTIFREYTQLGNPSRDRRKGIGLGLALVRRMCELLGHEIRVQSELGKGSCFYLELPIGNPDNMVLLSKEPETELIRDLDIMIIDDEQPILDAMSTLIFRLVLPNKRFYFFARCAQDHYRKQLFSRFDHLGLSFK